MASRGKMGAMVLVALGSLALQACIAVPVRDGRYHRAYGYGGSGLVSNVNPQQAERECIRTARDFRGYRGVRSEGVDLTGPDTARVALSARTWGGISQVG